MGEKLLRRKNPHPSGNISKIPLAMMSPFGVKEKQALLEAHDLKHRAEVLIAIAEMDVANGSVPHSTVQ